MTLSPAGPMALCRSRQVVCFLEAASYQKIGLRRSGSFRTTLRALFSPFRTTAKFLEGVILFETNRTCKKPPSLAMDFGIGGGALAFGGVFAEGSAVLSWRKPQVLGRKVLT